MTTNEAIRRINDHIAVHQIYRYPHLELWEALIMAISALCAQQQTQKNDPLTLEELREMDGEPVFCVDKVIPKRSAWGIVCIRNEIPFIRTFQDGGGFSTFLYLGKLNFDWLAYRHKPEEV